MVLQLIKAFSYRFFEKLCRNSMTEYYSMMDKLVPGINSVATIVRKTAGSDYVQELLGKPIDIVEAKRGDDNRERARD